MAASKETKREFDTAVYPAEAVMGAAYKYLDRMYCHLTYNGSPGVLSAALKPKGAVKKAEWEALLDDFHEEVTTQALRMKILDFTRDTRDRIMSIALYCVPPDGRPASAGLPEDCGAGVGERKREEELDAILARIKEKMGEAGDYGEDPMDIMTPWEDKYGDRDAPPPELEGHEDDKV